MELRDPVRSTQAVVIAGAIAFVLQVALAPQLSIGDGRFNFLLAYAGAMALSGDTHRAVYVGFASGLLYDLTSTAPIGLMALLMTIGTFLLATTVGTAGSGLSARSIQYIVVYDVLVCVVNGALLMALGLASDVVNALLVRGFLTAALTVLASILFIWVGNRSDTNHRGFTVRNGSRYRTLR